VPTPAKKVEIDNLNQTFATCKAALLANYQGIPAIEMARLRRHLRDRKLEFKVIKNTFAQKAAPGTGFENLEEKFKGPISLLVSFDDAVAPAKALEDFAKAGAEKTPEVVFGVVEGKLVTAEQVKALANLPSKEQLLSQMLSVMQGPTRNFVGVLSGVTREFVGVLSAIKDKKEGGA